MLLMQDINTKIAANIAKIMAAEAELDML